MVTHGQAGIVKPNPKYALTGPSPVSAVPQSVRAALRDPHWRDAMQQEFDALIRNKTWTLVPRPPDARVLSGKWVWKIKTGSDGTFEHCKARWVVRGDRQQPGIDFGDTFSPVVKPATIRTVLTIIASKNWLAHQLDVSNVFLHGNIQERVYCQQPPGFADPARPNDVCLLSRSLYGLRQAPRAWFQRFVEHALSIGFRQTRTDSSLFVYKRGNAMAYLLLYVDDMILSASSQDLLQHIVRSLQSAFAVKDMGPVSYFLGIDVQRNREGFLLSQSSYALDVLDRAGMSNCKPVATPDETSSKASSSDGVPLSKTDASWYRSMAGHCICCAASLLAYACSHRVALRTSQAHPSLHQGDFIVRPPAPGVILANNHRVHRRGLGRVSGHATFHVGLRHLPRQLVGLMVLKTPDDCVPLERGGGVSRGGERCVRVHMASATATGALLQRDPSYHSLLRQHLQRVHVAQSSTSPAHETHRNRHPLRSGEGGDR